jgi:hypothetical protein
MPLLPKQSLFPLYRILQNAWQDCLAIQMVIGAGLTHPTASPFIAANRSLVGYG